MHLVLGAEHPGGEDCPGAVLLIGPVDRRDPARAGHVEAGDGESRHIVARRGGVEVVDLPAAQPRVPVVPEDAAKGAAQLARAAIQELRDREDPGLA